MPIWQEQFAKGRIGVRLNEINKKEMIEQCQDINVSVNIVTN